MARWSTDFSGGLVMGIVNVTPIPQRWRAIFDVDAAGRGVQMNNRVRHS